MIEAIILVMALLVMARKAKGKYRRWSKYIPGSVDEEMALGTLTTKDVIAAQFDQTVTERMFCSSVRAIWSMRNFTPTSNAGPILVGLAHSDYTAAEIEEWIENTQGWAEADQIGQEVGRRKIRKVGTFDTPDNATDSVTLNDGKAIKTKLGWILTTGQTLQTWGYNLGTVSLATTDPLVSIQGKANLWVA